MASPGRLHGFTHLPGPGPASGMGRGPLGHIAVRPKDLPELPTSVRPPAHARPRPRQATGQTRSTDLLYRLRRPGTTNAAVVTGGINSGWLHAPTNTKITNNQRRRSWSEACETRGRTVFSTCSQSLLDIEPPYRSHTVEHCANASRYVADRANPLDDRKEVSDCTGR